ncbi:hypothetical protein [Vallitalea maricola]|uniref:Uncharacterized protein n=1 Tax=Vallitalea maricola TaxID=3074433 RepID=A0ACB5UQ27_9FIRM|nr:hypothetical protein AN2V17_38810 [Vallitalea sp. AN17-2]
MKKIFIILSIFFLVAWKGNIIKTASIEDSPYDETVDMLDEYGDSGEITIIIDEYYIDLLESNVINEAKLIKVISK